MGILLRLILFSVIFSIINLSGVYVLSYKVNFIRITSVLLVFYVLLFDFKSASLKKSTIEVMKWSLILIFYKFILYSTVHFDHDLEPIYLLLKETFVVLLLPAFEMIGARTRTIRTILVCSIPAILLGILQIKNPAINLDSLIPTNHIIFTEGITHKYLVTEGRIVGAHNLAIGYAHLLGILCILLWSKYIMNADFGRRFLAIGSFLLIHFLIIFTQTRSAIYGVIPSILLAYVLSGERTLKKIAVVGAVSMVLFALFGSIHTLITGYSERSVLKIDANTYYKITANVYGTYGALSKNPLFGIRKSKGMQDSVDQYRKDYKRDVELIKRASRKLGRFLETKECYQLVQTHHNLYAFYLRYYGLIGFLLLVMLLLKIYRKISFKTHVTDKYMLLGVFFFILQYALFHNTMILEMPLFWILLSHGEENV